MTLVRFLRVSLAGADPPQSFRPGAEARRGAALQLGPSKVLLRAAALSLRRGEPIQFWHPVDRALRDAGRECPWRTNTVEPHSSAGASPRTRSDGRPIRARMAMRGE